MPVIRLCLAAAIVLALAGMPASAQPADPRRAVQQGKALPLRDILVRVLPRYRGQLLNAELVEERGVLVYKLRILDESGNIVNVTSEARTGRILDARK